MKKVGTLLKSDKGFTIVELLIVVVVIAILAAITIVSYNGITTRAKVSAMKDTVALVQKSIIAYSVDTNAYPTASANLTDSSSNGKPYQLTGITFLSGAPDKNSSTNTVAITKCDSVDGNTGGSGNQIYYWDANANQVASVVIGDVGAGCSIAP